MMQHLAGDFCLPPSLCSFFFPASPPAAAAAVSGWGMAAGTGNLWPCQSFLCISIPVPGRGQGATVPGAAPSEEGWQCESHAEAEQGKGIFIRGKMRSRGCLVLVFL